MREGLDFEVGRRHFVGDCVADADKYDDTVGHDERPDRAFIAGAQPC
jgi:hypothetical protein